MKKYLSVLLAVFVFVMGMTINGNAEAASVTESVTGTNKGIAVSMNVTLQNIDLKAYSKYNYVLKKDHPDHVFAKAIPGKEVSIIITPTSTDKKIDGSSIDFRSYQILTNSSKEVGYKDFQNNKSVVSGSYVIPKTADVVDTMVLLHYGPFDFKDGSFGQVSVTRQYYICTSDESFKKAYKMLTGKTLTGPISAPDSKEKQEKNKADLNKQNKQDKATVQNQNSDEDSGGLSTVGKVGIGLAAAGAIGFGVTHLGGGAGAGAGSGPAGAAEAETPPAPPEPESFVFTDPATGAQSLYEKDPETGQWVNQQTGGIADIDDLDRFAKQRQADADWTRGQMEKLSNRDTDLDRAWREQDAKTDAELQRKFEEIDRQGARDRVAIKSGTYGMSDAERTKYLTERQERLQKNSEAANQSAKNWDRITKTAEVVEKAADIAVDGLAVVTAPVGGTLVADVYSGAKNIAGSTSEAIAKGESIVGGITKGVAKGAADIVQNHAGGKWVKKLGTYAGSETLKEVIVAAVDGENVVDAAKKGLVNGTFKYAVSEIGDNISDGVSKQNENLMKQHYNKIKNVWSKDVSQKSVNALQSMNFQKYFGKETTRELAQGFGQSLTKEVGSATYDTAVEGKSVTESLFDDKW